MSVSELMPTLRTLTPGAKMSTAWPKLEKLALASVLASIAPTVMACGAEPGEVLAASCCFITIIRKLATKRKCAVGRCRTYVFITGGNNGDNAGSVEGLDGAVDGAGQGTAQGHVHDSLAGDAAPLDVVNDKLHAVEDARVGTAAVGAEDLDRDEVDVLCYTECGTANGAGYVAAVAVLVIVLKAC